MIRNEENHVLIDRLMDELESYSLKVGTELERLEAEKKEYLFFKDVLESLEKSKVDFCSSYFVLSEDEKSLFQNMLVSLFKDQEIVDHIIQEIINLYYLNERGLLEQEEVVSQKDVALENLETLATKISKYIKDIHYDLIIMNHDKLSKQMGHLMLLGSILEEDGTPVTDIEFLRETLNQIKLTPDERKEILMEIIRYNHSIYQEQIQELKQPMTLKSNDQDEEQITIVIKGLDDMLEELREEE